MAADGSASVEIDGAAGPDLLDRVLDELSDLWSALPEVPEYDRTLFSLAVSEILTNIAQHGRREGTVQVRVVATLEVLRAEIRDDSPPVSIDWGAVGMPEAEAESGRGLALAVASLDELRVEAEEAGNHWVLVRRIADDAGEDGSS